MNRYFLQISVVFIFLNSFHELTAAQLSTDSMNDVSVEEEFNDNKLPRLLSLFARGCQLDPDATAIVDNFKQNELTRQVCHAAAEGDLISVSDTVLHQALLGRYPLTHKQHAGATIAHFVIKKKDLQRLLLFNPNILTISSKNGEYPLHRYVSLGDEKLISEVINYIKEQNPDTLHFMLNAKNTEGITPLVIAAMLSQWKMVSNFVALGADPNVKIDKKISSFDDKKNCWVVTSTSLTIADILKIKDEKHSIVGGRRILLLPRYNASVQQGLTVKRNRLKRDADREYQQYKEEMNAVLLQEEPNGPILSSFLEGLRQRHSTEILDNQNFEQAATILQELGIQ